MNKRSKRPGRPKKGKELSKVVSIRLEPKKKLELINKYGSVQKWVDIKLNGG